MRRWLTASLSVGALALAVGACGGPTDATVIARGNAICEQTLAEIRVAPASAAGVTHAAALVTKEVRELQALPRPKRRRAVLSQFISAEAMLAREYAGLAAAERSHDSAAAARAERELATNDAGRLARSYGLSRCATAGPTVGSG